MKANLSTGKDAGVDASLGIIERFMAQNLRWVPAICTAPGPISHTSFVVTHTLGTKPHFVLGLPRQAGDTIGVSEAEEGTWTATTITIHASAVDAQFKLLIGTFGG